MGLGVALGKRNLGRMRNGGLRSRRMWGMRVTGWGLDGDSIWDRHGVFTAESMGEDNDIEEEGER